MGPAAPALLAAALPGLDRLGGLGRLLLLLGPLGLGLLLGLLNSMFFTSVIILILVSAIVTPILLKVLYHRDSVAQETEPSRSVS